MRRRGERTDDNPADNSPAADDRRFTNLAVQPGMGILPKRRSWVDFGDSPCFGIARPFMTPVSPALRRNLEASTDAKDASRSRGPTSRILNQLEAAGAASR